MKHVTAAILFHIIHMKHDKHTFTYRLYRQVRPVRAGLARHRVEAGCNEIKVFPARARVDAHGPYCRGGVGSTRLALGRRRLRNRSVRPLR